MREVFDFLMDVLSTGCQWRAIAKDLPPRSTVEWSSAVDVSGNRSWLLRTQANVRFDFDLWDYDGTLKRIHHMLFVACRQQAGREASPGYQAAPS